MKTTFKISVASSVTTGLIRCAKCSQSQCGMARDNC